MSLEMVLKYNYSAAHPLVTAVCRYDLPFRSYSHFVVRCPNFACDAIKFGNLAGNKTAWTDGGGHQMVGNRTNCFESRLF
jgi:hypothetical protein